MLTVKIRLVITMDVSHSFVKLKGKLKPWISFRLQKGHTTGLTYRKAKHMASRRISKSKIRKESLRMNLFLIIMLPRKSGQVRLFLS
jgi:hypothetical protein